MSSDLTKDLHQQMQAFQHRYGENIYKVYTSLIDYLCGYFDWKGHPVHGWAYTPEQNECFRAMAQTALKAVAEGMDAEGWYDIFGDIFMQHLADKDHRGQCFTPANMANLCVRMQLDDLDVTTGTMATNGFGHRYILNDPACGSGRLMLAGACHFIRRYGQRPYVICEDIDTTCVKQTALNLALHGLYGEVICHNSLREPDGLLFGYIINETMYPHPDALPSVRFSDNPQHFVGTRFWQSQMGTPNTAEEEKPKPQQQQPIQLTLF